MNDFPTAVIEILCPDQWGNYSTVLYASLIHLDYQLKFSLRLFVLRKIFIGPCKWKFRGGAELDMTGFRVHVMLSKGFPGGSDGKESACKAGNQGSIPKLMESYSNILAWRIPWAEEPSGLQSTGSQRVRHDWATNIHLCFKGPFSPFLDSAFHPFDAINADVGWQHL